MLQSLTTKKTTTRTRMTKPLPFTFTARWESICMSCMGPVSPGDEVGYINNSHACKPCLDAAVYSHKE